MGLSLALTFASILFDISDIFNAKGNYVKVSLSTIMYTVKDVVLMTLDNNGEVFVQGKNQKQYYTFTMDFNGGDRW